MCPARPTQTTASERCAAPCEALRQARKEVAGLTAELAATKRDNRRLQKELAAAKKTIAGLEAVRDEQNKRAKALQEQLQQAEQEAHRQAAPNRVPEDKRVPEDEKRKPGRKKGHKGDWRKPPEKVDERVEVPLPCCPHCKGPVTDVAPRKQIIAKLVFKVEHLELTTYTGICAQCGRVHSTHPEQVSTATGAAGTHLGQSALAFAAELSKRHGVTTRGVCAILKTMGLSLTPGGLTQALDRVADKLKPWADQIRDGLRQSSVVHVDETSWWLESRIFWLHVLTNKDYTYYVVAPRTSAVVRDVLGDAFTGVLVSDCLQIYDPLDYLQSKCVFHHLKAIDEGLKQSPHSVFLAQIKSLFKSSIDAKKHCLDEDELALDSRIYNALLDLRLAGDLHDPAEIKVRNRLASRRPHILTYLDYPYVDPTNNLAERRLRPAIIFRKLSAGNKTLRGARTFEILKSLTVTCHQQGRDFAALVAGAMSLGLPPPPPIFVEPSSP
ncbi:MAG: Transposase IS66 family protein [Planctomycetes bacterium ADurb.Bin126]|nr:MAG: Transposase IS66 family protein [Planctomycetes bacterium ADurb.Bin126]